MEFSYKIEIICGFLLIALLKFSPETAAQQLKIVKKSKSYFQQVEQDSLKEMIELKQLVPHIVYDLKYATKRNFTGIQLYKSGQAAFLRKEPAQALRNLSRELSKMGYGLKIFDAYRPYAVTKKMWELIHDERYVANPAKGSGHNRGLSVDLSLIRLSDSSELDMGTDFDHFSDTAHHAFTQLDSAILEHRKILKEIMEKHGFKALDTEWWHYSWPNNRDYEVLDIKPEKLLRRSL